MSIFFEDIEVGQRFILGPYKVRRSELLNFNRLWDPLPIHISDKAARRRGFKGITASGQYTLCIKQRLLNTADWTEAVIGALAFDELRFPKAVYPGDELTLKIECLESRGSKSKNDRGIVKFDFRMLNQDNSEVLRYLDTVMFSRSSIQNL